jgi:hypothetical protein
MTGAARHLVTVWNPSYADDALTAHASMLLAAVRSAAAAKDWTAAYVWWGKVRSSHRLQPMPHLVDVLALDAALDQDEPAEVWTPRLVGIGCRLRPG